MKPAVVRKRSELDTDAEGKGPAAFPVTRQCEDVPEGYASVASLKYDAFSDQRDASYLK